MFFRPGTRYRTQSEKDPHYQRRLRMRRRQIESSDERSRYLINFLIFYIKNFIMNNQFFHRSPSPDRRKFINAKSKIQTLNKPKVKIVTYDADLSMDSLNSAIIPLRTDKNGRIIIEENKCEHNDKIRLNAHINDVENIKELQNENFNIWCGQEILSKLSTLKNVFTLCYMLVICFNILIF